jgi:hypothetical protein
VDGKGNALSRFSFVVFELLTQRYFWTATGPLAVPADNLTFLKLNRTKVEAV